MNLLVSVILQVEHAQQFIQENFVVEAEKLGITFEVFFFPVSRHLREGCVMSLSRSLKYNVHSLFK